MHNAVSKASAYMPVLPLTPFAGLMETQPSTTTYTHLSVHRSRKILQEASGRYSESLVSSSIQEKFFLSSKEQMLEKLLLYICPEEPFINIGISET